MLGLLGGILIALGLACLMLIDGPRRFLGALATLDVSRWQGAIRNARSWSDRSRLHNALWRLRGMPAAGSSCVVGAARFVARASSWLLGR